MLDFYVPQTKRELVSILGKRYKGKIKGFKDMGKAQLKAILINTRKRDERGQYGKNTART